MIQLCLLSVLLFFGIFFSLTLKVIKEQDAAQREHAI